MAEPGDPGARAVIERYVQAFEAADVPGLVRLLADEAVLEMPPVPLWYRGRGDYGRFMDRVFSLRGPGWAARPLTANGRARAGRVRAGTRGRAPAAHPAGLHRGRRTGHQQRGVR